MEGHVTLQFIADAAVYEGRAEALVLGYPYSRSIDFLPTYHHHIRSTPIPRNLHHPMVV